MARPISSFLNAHCLALGLLFFGTQLSRANDLKEIALLIKEDKAVEALKKYKENLEKKMGALNRAQTSSCKKFWAQDSAIFSVIAKYSRQLKYVFENFPEAFSHDPQEDEAFRRDLVMLTQVNDSLTGLSTTPETVQKFSASHLFQKYYTCNYHLSFYYVAELIEHSPAEDFLKHLNTYTGLIEMFGVWKVYDYFYPTKR